MDGQRKLEVRKCQGACKCGGCLCWLGVLRWGRQDTPQVKQNARLRHGGFGNGCHRFLCVCEAGEGAVREWKVGVRFMLSCGVCGLGSQLGGEGGFLTQGGAHPPAAACC